MASLPLLLLPGLLCDERLWRDPAQALAEVAPIYHADLTRDDSVAKKAVEKRPIRDIFTKHRKDVLRVIGVAMAGNLLLGQFHLLKDRQPLAADRQGAFTSGGNARDQPARLEGCGHAEPG